MPRISLLQSLNSTFGVETDAIRIYLDEIVSDRYSLVNGMQILHDELQLAFWGSSDVKACAADLSQPTVITTLAHTNCGDRIQREATPTYERIVGTHLIPVRDFPPSPQLAQGSRFATLSEDGRRKVEMFSPAGGGTDDGYAYAESYAGSEMTFSSSCSFILAHVTVAHQMDSRIRHALYNGNPKSYVRCASPPSSRCVPA